MLFSQNRMHFCVTCSKVIQMGLVDVMTATDKRVFPRVRSFLRGEIVYSNGAQKADCTIRDISDNGARLQCSSAVAVPEFFVLTIPQRGSSERAQIVWRHGIEVGVIFPEKSVHLPKTESGVATRIAALESEVEMLRSQLEEITAFLVKFGHNSGSD
jgi:PilZ domain